jgi:hypothetical protein
MQKHRPRTTREKSKLDIRREYKEHQKPAGVFQVKNTANGKVLLGSNLNLEGALNMHQFMLTSGYHRNTALQNDWNTLGTDKFVFEILEIVEIRNDP